MPTYETRRYTVSSPGPRLDRYLTEVGGDLSRSRIQHLVVNGLVTVNEGVARAGYKVRPGDRIVVQLPPPAPLDLAPESIPLTVVYEDEDLAVIDKPAGLVVHPGPGHPAGTLVNALLSRCPELAGVGGGQRPGIVHRLDKDTSGLIVVAKNQRAHESLSQQIKDRLVTKRYVALVSGAPELLHGTIQAPLGRDPRHRQRMAVVASGRQATTHYRVVERLGPLSLLDVQIETGRTHQIRVHLAFLGHPVVGDATYGRRQPEAGGRAVGIGRQFLHARLLGFRLPSSGEYREFQSALPPDLQEALTALRSRAEIQSRPATGGAEPAGRA